MAALTIADRLPPNDISLMFSLAWQGSTRDLEGRSVEKMKLVFANTDMPVTMTGEVEIGAGLPQDRVSILPFIGRFEGPARSAEAAAGIAMRVPDASVRAAAISARILGEDRRVELAFPARIEDTEDYIIKVTSSGDLALSASLVKADEVIEEILEKEIETADLYTKELIAKLCSQFEKLIQANIAGFFNILLKGYSTSGDITKLFWFIGKANYSVWASNMGLIELVKVVKAFDAETKNSLLTKLHELIATGSVQINCESVGLTASTRSDFSPTENIEKGRVFWQSCFTAIGKENLASVMKVALNSYSKVVLGINAESSKTIQQLSNDFAERLSEHPQMSLAVEGSDGIEMSVAHSSLDKPFTLSFKKDQKG